MADRSDKVQISLQQSEASCRQSVSSVMDGAASSEELASASEAWGTDGRMRQCWHTYHLIGDVLRSDELAVGSDHDAEFLRKLRARLADEPVALAERRRTIGRAWTGWQAKSLAATAGFAAVAGIMLLMRPGPLSPPSEGHDAIAARSGPAESSIAMGQLVRDAQLDRYLTAHRRVSNGSPVVVPGAIVRSVDIMASDDK